MAKERARKSREYDTVVRALVEAISTDAVIVDYEPRDDRDGTPVCAPDLILRDKRSRRVLRVCAIETRCSTTRPRSESWRELARHAPLTLIVPKGAARDAERLLWNTDARIVEYERLSEARVVFQPRL